MKKIIIAAVDENFAIGNQNRLPWQGLQRADMKRFVHLTMGYPIIMGRKTYESIPKRPLVGRTNIIITRQRSYPVSESLIIAHSLEHAFGMAEMRHSDQAFVIGGEEIYWQALAHADDLRITIIHHEFQADAHFPSIDPAVWHEVRRIRNPADNENRYPYSFAVFTRSDR